MWCVVQSLGGRCMSSNNISYRQKGDKTQTTRCRSSREKRKTCPKKTPPTCRESHISTCSVQVVWHARGDLDHRSPNLHKHMHCMRMRCLRMPNCHRCTSPHEHSCCAERKVRSERAMSHVVPTLLAFKVRTMAREQRGQCHTGTAGADRAVPEPPGTPPAIGQQKGA